MTVSHPLLPGTETTAMPIHDWTRVEPGIFHSFHHDWITAIKRALNSAQLPEDYYALAEQQAAGSGPDVLSALTDVHDPSRFIAQTDAEFYRRKKSSVVVRNVSDDSAVAIVEIVSAGNKATRNVFRQLLDKVCKLLERKIHLLIIDLLPPTKLDPRGIHAAIWQELVHQGDFRPPADKPLTLVTYEAGSSVTAYLEPVAVGDPLPAMPLFLKPEAYVLVPLEQTYQEAWQGLPRRWQRVLEG
jgi:hypothetical protein